MPNDDGRESSNARLERARQMALDRESARADYEARAKAERDNMARLKALRLAQARAAEQSEPGRTGAARRRRRSP